jgi:hypothetical protein
MVKADKYSKQIQVNGKGVLSFSNIENVCKHGKEQDINTVLEKVSYSMDKTQEKIDNMELGFELIGLDISDLNKKIDALKSVGASKKEIKKVIGKKTEQVKEYNGLISYLSYLDMIKDKLEDAK